MKSRRETCQHTARSGYVAMTTTYQAMSNTGNVLVLSCVAMRAEWPDEVTQTPRGGNISSLSLLGENRVVPGMKDFRYADHNRQVSSPFSGY